jgi:diguanylate cyclase (GGDEF)-like protein
MGRMAVAPWCALILQVLLVGGSMATVLPDGAPHDPLAEPRFVSVGVGAIPRAVVPAIAQDRAGFLWVATGDGLVRYDGYRFRPQERESPNPRLRNLGWIRALLAARDGRVWIGTESDGLMVYDPRTDQITPAGPPSVSAAADAVHRPVPTIRALAEDADGVIWSGSIGGGLERFDPRTGVRSVFARGAGAGELPDDRVLSLLVDRQGHLWVGTWQGLVVRRHGSDRFEPVLASPSAEIRHSLAGMAVQALTQASDGRIWIGTQQGRLQILDPRQGRVQVLSTGDPGPPGRQGAVAAFVEAPGGQMWVGRNSGIGIWRVVDGQALQFLHHDASRPDGLAGDEVTALLRDPSGLVWVAGLGLGLQSHDLNNHAIRVRGADPEPASPLKQVDVRGLLELDDGAIWAATPWAGVAVLDPQLRVVGVLPQAQGTAHEARPAPLRAQALVQVRDGSVWLATEGRLQQRDRKGLLLRSLPLDGGQVFRLVAAADGGLWVCSQNGLYRLAPGAAAAVPVARSDGQPWIGEVYAVAETKDGQLWVGSAQGLYRVAAGAERLEAVPAEPGAELGNPIVIGLLIDRDQSLWLDTAVTGLHHMQSWNGRSARFDRVSERHGVLNRPFGANLVQDAQGRIWTQLYVYDPRSDRLKELTQADGVNIGTPWFHVFTRLRSGRFLFGGSNGMLVVDADRYEPSSYAPPLVATELRVNGVSRHIDPTGAQLQLAPDDRSFSLDFAALDYSDPARVRYAYRLEGFDPDWISTRADLRAASYSNLDPGDYVLRVRATNRSGDWGPHELALALQVMPPWWARWWARLLMVVLLTATVLLVVQWRTRQLRHRHVLLQKLVQERTQELEATTDLLRQESAALRESSLTDPLTGLRNRRFLTRHIDVDVALSMRRYESHWKHAGPLPVDADLLFFMVDIDRFKQVNDAFGHAAGDAVLMQMRERLEQVFRDADYMVRWGGEEFLLVARWITRDHVAELAERARRAVAERPFTLDDGRLLHCTCSLGFACFPPSIRHPRLVSWNETVNLADAALYAAKTAGRNGWAGLVDTGTLDEAALLARPAPEQWFGQDGMTVLRSTPPPG